MPQLTITTDSYDNARSFLIQFLKDAGFNGSTESGTAIHDLVIKPLSLFYTIFSDAVIRAKAYNSIDYATQIKDLLGEEEYSQVVDSIMSNWFVYRKEGIPSRGTIRLFFSRPVDYLEIKQSPPAFSINRIPLETIREYVISPNSFKSVYNTERYSVEYYIDVDVQTSINTMLTDSDLRDGVVSSIGSVYFLRAEIVGDFIPGEVQESDEDFISRTQNVVNTRELITIGSVTTVLPDVFNGINNIYIAGFGDDEQLRDVYLYDTSTIHVGNKADIYVSTNMTKNLYLSACDYDDMSLDLSTIESHIAEVVAVRDPYRLTGNLKLHFSEIPASITLPNRTMFQGNGVLPDLYTESEVTYLSTDFTPSILPNDFGGYLLVPVASDTILKDDNLEFDFYVPKNIEYTPVVPIANVIETVSDEDFVYYPVSYTVTADNEFQWGKVGGTIGITISPGESYVPQGFLFVEYIGSTLYRDIQDYVTDSRNRVVCYDPNIKSKFPVVFYFNIQVDALTTDLEAVKTQCKSVITNYVNTISGEEAFSVYDMIGELNSRATLITQARLPITIQYFFRDPETLVSGSGTVVNEFYASDMITNLGITNEMVTDNTLQWYTCPEFITISIASVREI